ncbi:MAG: hypothetical protein HMLKMBBP_00376 [Planctomycetes bacterium]|nr:hypothetical protein [Planctomycetota bacterium]
MADSTAEISPDEVGVRLPRPWQDFRAAAPRMLALAERCVRHAVAHDSRAASVRVASIDAAGIASAAYGWALAERGAMPSSATPVQWMLRRAIELVDERLEAADAHGARRPPAPAEERLRAMGVLDDESERARWLDLAAAECEMTGEIGAGATATRDTARLVAVEEEIQRLPERRRRVVELRLLDDLTTEDAAFLLEMTEDEVRRELASALKAIRLGVAR